MIEFYVIKRTDKDQYYNSLTHTGDMLWTDSREQARWLTEKDAETLIDRVNGGSNPKYDELEIELT